MGFRDFSVSDCTIAHERIIQFSFMTAYEDMVPDEKVTFLATLRVWSERKACPKVPWRSVLMALSWCWYSCSRQVVSRHNDPVPAI